MPVWVDANVLLRFLTKVPAEMAERAKKLLQRGEKGELQLRVHSLSVAETVWVLESFYEYEKKRVADELSSLLDIGAMKAEDLEVIVQALHWMAEKNVDFADAYLAAQSRAHGDQVASFDREFKRL